MSVRRLVRDACGGRELLVSEVHQLVEQMQIASHSDEFGDLLVECLDVLLGDEQVRSTAAYGRYDQEAICDQGGS